MSLISAIDVQLFRVPLSEVLYDASHGDHTHFELITATVKLDDGASGTGYTYTGGKGGHAIAAMIERDLKANPNYWGKKIYPNEVTEIIYTPIQSSATRVAALLSGEVDLIQDVPVQDLGRVQS